MVIGYVAATDVSTIDHESISHDFDSVAEDCAGDELIFEVTYNQADGSDFEVIDTIEQ